MTTDELRALERAKDAVIEAARRHKATRNFFLETPTCLHRSACDCGVCKALDALDSAAAPSATAGAYPSQVQADVDQIRGQVSDIFGRLLALEAVSHCPKDMTAAILRLESRLKKLEASRLSSPVRTPDGPEITKAPPLMYRRCLLADGSTFDGVQVDEARQLSAAAEKRGRIEGLEIALRVPVLEPDNCVRGSAWHEGISATHSAIRCALTMERYFPGSEVKT